jgi:hypothetical protein
MSKHRDPGLTCPTCGRRFYGPGPSTKAASYALCVGGPWNGKTASFLSGERVIDPREIPGWVYAIDPEPNPLARLAGRGATHVARWSLAA